MYQNFDINRNSYPHLPGQDLAQPLRSNPTPSYPSLPLTSNMQSQGHYILAPTSGEQHNTSQERLAELNEKLEKDFSWFKVWIILTWVCTLCNLGYSLIGYGFFGGYKIVALVLCLFHLVTVIMTFMAVSKKRMQLATASFVMLMITTICMTIYIVIDIYSGVRSNNYYGYDYNRYNFLEIVAIIVRSIIPLLMFIITTIMPMNRIRAIMAERETLKSL